MSGRAELLQRSRQLKRRRKIIQLIVLCCLMLVLFVLTIYTFYRPGWRVSEVAVSGTKSVKGDEVVHLINEHTSGSYFWLAPKNSRLFYPENKLIGEILKNFPRIATLEVNSLGQKVEFNIAERESKLLWCFVGDSVEKECYFADQTGFAFAKAPSFTDHVLFEAHQRVSSSTTATSSVAGRFVLSESDLNDILRQKEFISDVLAKEKIFDRSIIINVELLAGDNYLFSISSPSFGDDWLLFTSAKMPGELLAGRLETLIKSGSFVENISAKKQPLAYIDLRLANKAFFKVLENNVETTP